MKKFSRKEIYNELLTNTLKELAIKYRINYADFSKFCHKNNIPIPDSKYRMYLKMGKDLTGLIKPLPKASSDVIYFETNENHKIIDSKDNIETTLQGLNDPQKLQQIKDVLITFKYNSKKPLSEKVRTFKKSIKQWKNRSYIVNSYGWNSNEEKKPKFIDNISPKELPRLYRLLDSIYLILDQLGEEVKDDFSVIIGGKDEVNFDILECKDQVKHQLTSKEKRELKEYEEESKKDDWAYEPRIRKYDHPYNGRLKIRFNYYIRNIYIRDSKDAKLEDKLPQIIINFYKTYIQVRDDRIKREEEERRENEEKKRKIMHDKAVNDEKDKIQILIAKVHDYKLATQIREYAKFIKDKDYRNWMLQKADWLDPNTHQEDEILGKRNYDKDSRNLNNYLSKRIDINEFDW